MLGPWPARETRVEHLRLGIDRQRLARCSVVVQQAIERLQAWLAEAGIELCAIALPPQDIINHAHAVTVLSEAKVTYPDWPDYAQRLPATAQRALAAAQNITDTDTAIASDEIVAIQKVFNAALAEVDAILTPTLPVEPPLVGVNRLQLHGRSTPLVSALVSETCLANLVGAPALSMPIPDSLASLQLLGRQHHDAQLFSIGRAAQTAIQAG